MASVKTAVSIQESLFKDVNVLAHKMHVPRSRLFDLALREFLQKHQNKQLFQRLNSVYDEAPGSEEIKWHRMARSRYRRLVAGQW